MSEWIKLSERKPKERTALLSLDDGNLILMAYYKGGLWFEQRPEVTDLQCVDEPHYWISLPDPPKPVVEKVAPTETVTLLDYYAAHILANSADYALSALYDKIPALFDIAERAVAESQKRQPKRDSGG